MSDFAAIALTGGVVFLAVFIWALLTIKAGDE